MEDELEFSAIQLQEFEVELGILLDDDLEFDSPVRHLSHSSLDLLMTCGEAWRRRYVEKEKGPVGYQLPFGTAFHNIIEQAIMRKAQGDHEVAGRMSELFEREFNGQIETQEFGVSWDETNFDEQASLGAGMLNSPAVISFVESFEPLLNGKGEPCVEMKINYRVEGVPVPIIGFIDLVDVNGVPYDLKTSARRWGQNKADDSLQATLYLAAMRQMGAKKNPEMQFNFGVFVKTMPTIVQIVPTYRTEQKIRQLDNLIKSLWEESIKKGSFPTTGKNTWKCDERYCEFWPTCKGGGGA